MIVRITYLLMRSLYQEFLATFLESVAGVLKYNLDNLKSAID